MALSSEVTRQQDKQLIESCLSLMSIPATSFHANRKRIHLDKCSPSFCFIRMTCHEATCHRISSPTQVRWLRQLWGLRPSLSFASTEAPDFSSSATTSTWPFIAAPCSGVPPRGGGHGARPGRGSSGPSFRAHCTRPGSSQK